MLLILTEDFDASVASLETRLDPMSQKYGLGISPDANLKTQGIGAGSRHFIIEEALAHTIKQLST